MMPSYWPPVLSPVFNHLWQSTFIAGVAGMLALLLRRNHAQIRYWLWLAASVKFLIPFSALVVMASRFSRSTGATGQPAILSSVVEQLSQPFAQGTPALPAVHNIAQSHPEVFPALLPYLLLAIWFVGFVGVLLRWLANWQRVRSAMSAGSRLSLESDTPILSIPGLMEPSVFGIWRPVLLLPEGITDHLSTEQLKAILAHELCHVRRRDNLAAAVHMVVEAIFWFYPPIWWVGSRLVEERERACDEEVLRMGNEPNVYAESILKACQFYLEAPLACMSGVTGSDLKQRMVRIMAHQVVRKLGLGRKLVLGAVGLAALAVPVAVGLSQSPAQAPAQAQSSDAAGPTFEAASIKPAKSGAMGSFIRNQPGGRFSVNNMSVKILLTTAYDVQPFQIVGGPSWLDSDRYDVEAKAEESADGDAAKPSPDMRKQMETQRLRLQSLLTERCKLTMHRETRQLPVYAMVIAKGGPKLKESPVNTTGKPNMQMRMGFGQLNGVGTPLSFLAETLSRQLGRVVLDKTGLAGNYDFSLQWTPDPAQMAAMGPPPGAPPGMAPPPPDPNGPSVFTAIQEQLGLKLESQKGPVEVLVIDSAERPSEN